ncbi:chaplin [Streptomyces sp. NPDC002676]
MRVRTFAATALVAGALALGGSTTAFAADPDPTTGVAQNSPGVFSGNVVQFPVDVDANVCGNTIGLVGLLDPAFGTFCSNAG